MSFGGWVLIAPGQAAVQANAARSFSVASQVRVGAGGRRGGGAVAIADAVFVFSRLCCTAARRAPPCFIVYY